MHSNFTPIQEFIRYLNLLIPHEFADALTQEIVRRIGINTPI